MLQQKTILISLLIFVPAAFSLNALTGADLLKKPHVLPASEKAYHAVYHQLGSSHGGQQGHYGQLYVALLEDQFTFGGDFDYWPANKYYKGNKKCKSFMGTNVHHLCNDDYFLVHQDMIELSRHALPANFQSLETACPKDGHGLGATSQAELIYRYKNRVPMMYKESSNTEKCIGTYDTETDTFTCMQNPDLDAKSDSGKPLAPREISGFLWNSDGTFRQVGEHAEIFCKKLHYKI